jgi:hypothetical protein
MENTSIILVFVEVAREPIEWLTAVLIVSCRSSTSHLIFLMPNLLFLSRWQLTFASYPKQATYIGCNIMFCFFGLIVVVGVFIFGPLGSNYLNCWAVGGTQTGTVAVSMKPIRRDSDCVNGRAIFY